MCTHTHTRTHAHCSGFASSQAAYDTAFNELFSGLDKVEGILANNRYLCGDTFTIADVRLFMTLIRFDCVYIVYFKVGVSRGVFFVFVSVPWSSPSCPPPFPSRYVSVALIADVFDGHTCVSYVDVCVRARICRYVIVCLCVRACLRGARAWRRRTRKG